MGTGCTPFVPFVNSVPTLASPALFNVDEVEGGLRGGEGRTSIHSLAANET